MKGKLLAVGAFALAQVCFAQDTPANSADQRYENLRTAVNIGELTVSSAVDGDHINRAMNAMGWLEGVYAVLEINVHSPMVICVPPGVSRMSMARIYLNYMDANPQSHGMPDVAVAVISAVKAFPCKQPNS